jgi:hypothetical protein
MGPVFGDDNRYFLVVEHGFTIIHYDSLPRRDSKLCTTTNHSIPFLASYKTSLSLFISQLFNKNSLSDSQQLYYKLNTLHLTIYHRPKIRQYLLTTTLSLRNNSLARSF